MQFGVPGFFHDKMRFSLIAEDTASVRQPGHLYPVSRLKVVDMNSFALESGTLNVCARGKRGYIRLPVVKTEKLGEQTKRRAACSVCAVDIAPEALERSGRYILMQPLLDDAGEKLKIIRSTDLALHFMLNIHPQGCYFGCVFIHIGCKDTIFF